MKLKSKIGTLVIAGIVGAGALLAAPAQAGSTLCPAKMNCIYQDLNYGGLLGYRGTNVPTFNLSAPSNDKMTSWENKMGNNAAWYEDAGGSGLCHTMPKNSFNPNVPSNQNDKMSSWKTTGGC
jgi:hypothetical protein